MIRQEKTDKHWIDEYHKGVRYGLEGSIIHDEENDIQRITIIESDRYGKALLLNGCWMTAEYQEKCYHECLVHPALSSAENIKNILIIGGGDGGTAKECIRYKEIERIDLVEIDNQVIELTQKFMPELSKGAWKDPRINVHIEDGIDWVRKTTEKSYDVVIVDSSDPIGPAEGLFNKKFYIDCNRILANGGIFATQSESPESFKAVHIETIKTIREVFDFADPIYGSVPMYPSGWWSWTFASNNTAIYKNPIRNRVKEVSKELDIWSIKWQKGAFDAVPIYIERELMK